MNTEEFRRQARQRGHDLSLAALQRLHSLRLLVPLFRVTDTPVVGRCVEVEPDHGGGVRRQVFEAAADGRLRDPADEGYSVAWPYARPDGVSERWWNGFVYSSWQLLHVGDALSEYAFTRQPWWYPRGDRFTRDRRTTLTLAALSSRYLPAVLGRVRLLETAEHDSAGRPRDESDLLDLLRLGGLEPTELQPLAEYLLLNTTDDPMHKWVKLLRYAKYDGWSKLTGRPLACMWQRVAAEILLRAHEDLHSTGHVGALPDLAGETWHGPHHDRLTPRFPEAETLERVLAELGLSPHPSVILLVEGKTELRHLPKLLDELGLRQPQDVRVHACHSTKVNAQLIARYGITPRIGRKLADRWLLDASPTALVIAMDPEGFFATPQQRAQERRKLQNAIRDEVRYQDADISQEVLDILVSVHVWGDTSYELANFTDDELVTAIAQLAVGTGQQDAGTPQWQQELHTHLQEARHRRLDIDYALGRVKAPKDKPVLADILWSTLRTKCERELASDTIETPVLRVALEVRRLATRMSGVFALEMPTEDSIVSP